jgi:hypothetical protein
MPMHYEGGISSSFFLLLLRLLLEGSSKEMLASLGRLRAETKLKLDLLFSVKMLRYLYTVR